MKRSIFIILLVILLLFGGWLTVHFFGFNQATRALKAAQKEREQQIEDLLTSRRSAITETEAADVFGDDNVVNILLIGLDSRLGETNGHCDAIQYISLDRKKATVSITAVPRGTYVPLPGVGYKPTDYYVSNSCGLISLEYGIEQIERILGQKADYIAVVGFSSTVGILRAMDLPTTETIQWLRNRQTYAIGEPQRAHNHSTFLKQMLVKYSGGSQLKIDAVWQYLVYKMIKTDLTFDQVKSLVSAVMAMGLTEDKVALQIRPYHDVIDITYDPTNVSKDLDPLQRIVPLLPNADYSGETQVEYQKRLLGDIEENLADEEFVPWAFDQFVWMQIDDDYTREFIHFDILTRYLDLTEDQEKKAALLADYVNEMDSRGLTDWADKGRQALEGIVTE
ncbi:TPA: hypothetical protein DF272_01760 [Candidatus Falkowbacteria bacterium]|nr:hypothetical protein [Candidatus Falkowbacteria bacterium]